MPSTLSILTATFRNSRQRAQAIAIWSAAFALGLGIGPLLGGWLLEHFSWQAIFYLNLPVVALGLGGVYRWVEDSKAEKPHRADIPGVLLSLAGFVALLYALIQAGIDGWTDRYVLGSFGAAALLLAVFGCWEVKARNAMLPLKLFKNRSFSGANLALTLVYFSLFGVFFLLSQFLQSVQGYSPLQAGVRILPIAGTTFLFAAMSASLARWIGTRYISALGILISGAGLYYFSRVAAVDTSFGLLAAAMCIISAGIGLTVSPLTNSIMGSVPLDQAGVGAAMNDTTRQIGGALGVAVLGTLLNSHYLRYIESLKELARIPSPAAELVRSGVQGAHAAAQMMPNSDLSQAVIGASNTAFTGGMAEALGIAAFILLAASVLTLVILPNRIERTNSPSI